MIAMKVIEGFALAKSVLSRSVIADSYQISSGMKHRLKEMFGTTDPEQVVRQIVTEVRNKGDAALFDYTHHIDSIELSSLEVDKQQIKNAYSDVTAKTVEALRLAAERISSFHIRQKNSIGNGFEGDGVGQLIRPLQRIGVYVPGGTASYPSTVLMTAIPARVAGVEEIVLVTPPQPNSKAPSLILVAADIAGIDRIFTIGGAQAVAALAYGTETVPCVDKICGPGNIFVVLAKKLVYGAVGIDGLQGPSEVLIIADEKSSPEYCAADILAQAEHDPLASTVLLTTSRKLADEVNLEVGRQLAGLSRQAIATESLASGVIAVVTDVAEAISLANLYAPEHLCLMVQDANSYLDKITNAGCIVLGEKATVVLGDYIAGPSHALPTGGTARFSSPLSVADFVKLTNLIEMDKVDLEKFGQAAAVLATAEGFEAHTRAIVRRLCKKPVSLDK
jgi:histidinol dehydrogenase